MPKLPPTSGRGRPLSELRKALSQADSDAAIETLIKELASDPRMGAHALAERGRRVITARAGERERLAGLLRLRDELAARGVRGIAGIDEVGVGPLAGSVVAAAVILPDRMVLRGLDDSKRVRRTLRESLAMEIREIAIGVGIGEVTPEEIDQYGIYHAALEAMRRSVASLARTTEVGHLLVDARTVPGVDLPQTSIIRGDQKDASIAAASIVAKVHRDAQMVTLGRRYPAYGFDRHMGYGTAEHMAALEREGPCPIHRRSFAPVEKAERRVGRESSAHA
ncbi:MAG: ribonuclease HII [bacterium]|nr:ribonuclease HII [bacterium]